MFVIVFHKSLAPYPSNRLSSRNAHLQCPNDDKRCICAIRSQGPTAKSEWGNGYGWMEAEQNLVWVGQGQRWQLICKWHVKFGIFWGDWKNTKRGNQEGLWQKASPLPKESLHYICRPRNIHVGCMSFITFEIDKVSYLPEIVKGWEGSDFVQITKLMEAELIVHCY